MKINKNIIICEMLREDKYKNIIISCYVKINKNIIICEMLCEDK